MRFKTFFEKNDVSVWFHGRSVDSEAFDHRFINLKGNLQDGVGFYFTDELKDALQYKDGGIVLKCELSPRKILNNKSEIIPEEIEFMMKNAPNLSDTLSNWGEDHNSAFRMAYDSLMNYSDSPVELFQQIWYDFYHVSNDDIDYMKNMITLGYDGTEPLSEWKDSNHIIIFNPKTINVIEKIV